MTEPWLTKVKELLSTHGRRGASRGQWPGRGGWDRGVGGGGCLPAWMVSKDPEVGVLRVLEGSLLGQKSNSFHKRSFAFSLDPGLTTKGSSRGGWRQGRPFFLNIISQKRQIPKSSHWNFSLSPLSFPSLFLLLCLFSFIPLFLPPPHYYYCTFFHGVGYRIQGLEHARQTVYN